MQLPASSLSKLKNILLAIGTLANHNSICEIALLHTEEAEAAVVMAAIVIEVKRK